MDNNNPKNVNIELINLIQNKELLKNSFNDSLIEYYAKKNPIKLNHILNIISISKLE